MVLFQRNCHSNCGPIDCSGSVCTVEYSGTIPMEMFNIKNEAAGGADIKSNMVNKL